MEHTVSGSDDRDVRGLIRFYLLDHQTPIGKAIDIGLLGLNLLFVGVVVAETYPIAASLRALLWNLEVGVAFIFAGEYLLRLYGAPDRRAEFLNGYMLIDLIAIVPTLLVFLSPVSISALEIGFLRALRVIRVLRFYRFTDDAEFFFSGPSPTTRCAPGDSC